MNWVTNEDLIAQAGAIAALLEVSGYPKPGNVHRTQNFADTRYEHFLVSSVVIIPILRDISLRGKCASRNEIPLSELNLGEAILKAVQTTRLWQRGGNTNLGIILLFTPLACAAGMLLTNSNPSPSLLRTKLDSIIRHSTPSDTYHLYQAIRLANPGGLGEVQQFDVQKTTLEDLQRNNLNLYEVFKLSAESDSISHEWISKFQTIFEIGYPFFLETFQKTKDINISIVHTYLKILGDIPDTLVARKYGNIVAERISTEAKHILNQGGLLSKQSIELLWKFDLELRDKEKINPGTSADLTAASLMVALLEGIQF